MNNQKIGNFIKILRKEKGYTQKQLADKLNITDRAISKWERGLGCPDISLLEDLSKHLDVSILEILKGEKIEKDLSISNKDLIYSMNLSKHITINKIKQLTNYITIISIIVFILILIITNIQSISITTQKYNMTKNNITYNEKYYYNEYHNKIDIINNNQGIFNYNDYSLIKYNLNIISETLKEQNNDKHLNKNKYTYKDLINFYNDHTNIYKVENANKEIYKILIKYNTIIIDNMIENAKTEDLLKELDYKNLFFLQQPYFIENQTSGHIPNTNYLIQIIYKRQLTLCNDIIKVGEI